MAWPLDGSQNSVQTNTGVTTGSTVTVLPSTNDILITIAAAGTLATLTIAVPADATTQIGQTIRIYSAVAVTALTVGGATIYGAPTALNANDNIGFQKVAANTYALVGIT